MFYRVFTLSKIVVFVYKNPFSISILRGSIRLYRSDITRFLKLLSKVIKVTFFKPSVVQIHLQKIEILK